MIDKCPEMAVIYYIFAVGVGVVVGVAFAVAFKTWIPFVIAPPAAIALAMVYLAAARS